MCALRNLVMAAIVRCHEVSVSRPICPVCPSAKRFVTNYLVDDCVELLLSLNAEPAYVNIREIVISLERRVIQIRGGVVCTYADPVRDLVHIANEGHKSQIPIWIIIKVLDVGFYRVCRIACLRKCGDRHAIALSLLPIDQRLKGTHPIIGHDKEIIQRKLKGRFARLKRTVVEYVLPQFQLKRKARMSRYGRLRFTQVSTYEIDIDIAADQILHLACGWIVGNREHFDHKQPVATHDSSFFHFNAYLWVERAVGVEFPVKRKRDLFTGFRTGRLNRHDPFGEIH